MGKAARQWLAAGCTVGGLAFLFLHHGQGDIRWHLVPFVVGALVVFPELGGAVATLVKACRAKR